MRLFKQEKGQTNNRSNTISRNIEIVILTKTCKKLSIVFSSLADAFFFFVYGDVLGDAEE